MRMHKMIGSLVAALTALAAVATTAAAPAETPNKLRGLLVVEAEHFVDAQGVSATTRAEKDSPNLFLNQREEASGEGFVTPVQWPYRIYKPFPRPVEATTEVDILSAGRWYVHVRYRVTPEVKMGDSTYREVAQRVEHFHPFGSFEVVIGGRKRFTVGGNQEKGAEFRWDTFEVDLPAGPTTVAFSMPDLAGPDCLVLTPVADYQPAMTDWAGPVWLRFKVIGGADDPFYIRMRCHFSPYEVRRRELRIRDAGWLFRGVVASTEEEARNLEQNPEALLSEGEWSPWVRTFTAKRKQFRGEAMVMPGPEMLNKTDRLRGLSHIEMSYQAATRPDEAFIVHEGAESTGAQRGSFFLLPTEVGIDAMRNVRSLSEWADDRMSYVTRLDLKPNEGPQRIKVTTMNNHVRTPREIDVFLESIRLLGYNGAEINQKLVDDEKLWQRIREAGFTWTQAHHLTGFWVKERLELPTTPPPPESGRTMQEVVDAFWYDKQIERIRRVWGNQPETRRRMIALANLADEPHPVPHFLWANCVPAIRICFHDFLRAHDVTPALFGKSTWEQVDIVGYKPPRWGGQMPRLLKPMNIDLAYWEPEGPVTMDELIQYEKVEGKAGEAHRYRVRVPAFQSSMRDASGPEEKRLYYWSQRFRSFYTRHFFGQTARVVEDLIKEGWLREDIQITPNFQAAPMMLAQMWDGGMDLFEWARAGTTDALMVEDWMRDPYRVGFGLTLLNAAARKHDQSLAHLIVADHHYRRRYLTALGLGVRTFVDYLYGPLSTIGPAWSNSAWQVRDRAEMLRLTRQVEDDLLATKLRPANTAILVANTSEINTVYYDATAVETGLTSRAAGGRPLFRRAGIYAALLDAGVPVEIVSEQAILEDGALDRYKALYVTDTHVRTPVQEAIREWVRGGGTLWADHTALARDQYDEESAVLNDVFGLTQRGQLPDPAQPPANDAAPRAITVAGDQVLEAVTFAGSLVAPDWKLSTARALATFDDSSPALTANQFGNGQAILLGCSALALSPYAAQATELADFEKARRVVTLAADLAGAVRHCHVSVPAVPSFVRDGPEQTVLVLLNSREAALSDVEVRLTVPHQVTNAFDGRGEAVAFEQDGDEVRFTVDLPHDDGDIIVFKW